MAHPPYPSSDSDSADHPSRRPRSATSRRLIIAAITAGVVLLALMIVLHLTGVLGPGEH
jgi:hypothetical protein